MFIAELVNSQLITRWDRVIFNQVLRKGLWDLLMALRIFSHKEFSRPLRGLGHFADSNGIPWNQTLISHAILTAAIQPKFLLSLFVLLSQQCHSSQIDEVSKFDDSKLSLHRIFQIPKSCRGEQSVEVWIITNLCSGGGRGSWLRASVPVVAILIRNDSARILKDLPPTQLCKILRIVYSWRGCDWMRRLNSAAVIKGCSVWWVGGCHHYKFVSVNDFWLFGRFEKPP